MLKLVTSRVGMLDNGVSMHTIWNSVWNGWLDDRLTLRFESVKKLEDCCFFLGRPKQNKPESQCYCAAVEVTAICGIERRREACHFDGVLEGDWKDKDM